MYVYCVKLCVLVENVWFFLSLLNGTGVIVVVVVVVVVVISSSRVEN